MRLEHIVCYLRKCFLRLFLYVKKWQLHHPERNEHGILENAVESVDFQRAARPPTTNVSESCELGEYFFVVNFYLFLLTEVPNRLRFSRTLDFFSFNTLIKLSEVILTCNFTLLQT